MQRIVFRSSGMASPSIFVKKGFKIKVLGRGVLDHVGRSGINLLGRQNSRVNFSVSLGVTIMRLLIFLNSTKTEGLIGTRIFGPSKQDLG